MKRRGFTLVEMLTVIVIIGILAALITSATIAARSTVKRGIITAEISQLKISIESYKSEVGEYPPDFSFCYHADAAVQTKARDEVLRHCRKRWPRAAGMTFADIEAACPYGQLSPSTALTFWLGGSQDPSGNMIGFHDDPSNPFKAGQPRQKPYYDFGGATRLIAGEYYAKGAKAPYVYFRSRKASGFDEFGMDVNGTFTPSSCVVSSVASSAGTAVPYLNTARGGTADPTQTLDVLIVSTPTILYSVDPAIVNREWRDEGRYQVISAGLDDIFSTTDGDATTPIPPQPFKLTPSMDQDQNWATTGIWFSSGDFDNITSFSGKKLEDE